MYTGMFDPPCPTQGLQKPYHHRQRRSADLEASRFCTEVQHTANMPYLNLRQGLPNIFFISQALYHSMLNQNQQLCQEILSPLPHDDYCKTYLPGKTIYRAATTDPAKTKGTLFTSIIWTCSRCCFGHTYMGFHIAPHKINFKEADKQSLNGNFDLEKYNLV